MNECWSKTQYALLISTWLIGGILIKRIDSEFRDRRRMPEEVYRLIKWGILYVKINEKYEKNLESGSQYNQTYNKFC